MSTVSSIGLVAQAPPPAGAPPAGGPPAAFRRPPDFPTRPPADPAVVERGKQIYSITCTFCHGADARGGSGGPNLIRTPVVLNDKNGELLGPVLKEGREGMPKFDLPAAQVSDIAAFLHSFRVGGYDISRMAPPTILVGDAKAGEAYFQKTCTSCHSVSNDLKGIGGRITDPKRLQQTWLMPGAAGRGPGAPPSPGTIVKVSVTQGGKKITGRLTKIDDFLVSLTEDDGTPRSFTRDGDNPKVELIDPLQGHRALLGKYTDKDIHDVTAFLASVK
ncbi:MAG: c-type cytochrome [Acidobacteria bacterium]|nr:c-type cytochrome [Acidobacteriota bacterium]